RDMVHSYARVGDNLVIKLEDGREIVLENMFVAQNTGTQLYFSSGGEIYEISFSEAWGRTNLAHYGQANATDGLVFVEGSELSTTLTGLQTDVGYAVSTTSQVETTMAAAPVFLAGGVGGVGAAAAGAAGLGVLAGMGGGGGGAAAATLAVLASTGGINIVSAGGGADSVINGAELAAGPVVTGQTYADSLVTVTLAGVTLTTTSDASGAYTVAFSSADLGITTVTTEMVSASVVSPDGNTETAQTDVLIDPITDVTIANTIVEGDGIILASETTDGIVITGSAEPGANVVITFLDTNRTVTAGADGSYSVTFNGAVAAGINDEQVTITAEATDLYGNVATTTQDVTVDTVLAVTIDPVQATDNVINRSEAQAGVTLTGTTDPGASVTIEMNGVTVNAVVAPDGTWTAQFPSHGIPSADVELTMYAHASDAHGNATSTSHVVVVDNLGMVDIDPSPLEIDDVVNATEQGDGVTVTGTTTPGSSVVVHFHTFTGNATVDAAGNWSVDIPAANIDMGTYDVTISATATTDTGNVSTDTETVRIDTEVLNLTSAPVAGDNFINQDEQAAGVTLSGTVEAGSTVMVSLGNVTLPATVSASGIWTVQFGPNDIPAGDYQTTMNAVAVDLAGNTHTISQTVHVDTVATNLQISSVPIAGDGVVNGNEASDGLEITGQADPGVEITVTLGGVTYTTTATPDGTWTVYFDPDDIGDGEFDVPLVVQTTDAAGNVTTDTTTVAVDTAVSGVDIPAGDIGGDGTVNADEISAGVVISGLGEPGATVILAVGNQEFPGVVGPDGTFAILIDPSAFPAGANVDVDITATITDAAGNVNVSVLTVNVDTEVSNFAVTTDPMAGHTVLNSIVAQSGIVIGGTVEPGATVSIDFAGTVKTVTAGANGAWSIAFSGDDVPVVEYETFNLVITATDASGNVAVNNSVFVTLDTSIPAAPQISQVGTVNGEETGSVNLAVNDGNYQIHAISGDGSSSNAVASDVYQLAGSGELYFDFHNNVPSGNDLIVQLNDDAGNSTSTLFVLDEPSTSGTAVNPTVSMGDAGYEDFNIQAVDMLNGDYAEMTITAEQLEDLSDMSDSLLIRGGTDDTVTAIGAVATNETREIEGETYDIYTMGDNGAYLIVDQDVTIVTS
ncbi:MAG: Ig-like domain-containing protein, partial [Pseudomonadota bacterium]